MAESGRGGLRLPEDPLLVDVGLAVFVTVIALAQQATSTAASADARSLGLIFAGAFPLVLVLRRRAPLAVLFALLAILVVWTSLGAPTSGAGIPLVVALYTVSAYRPAHVSLPVLAGTTVWLIAVRGAQGISAPDIVEMIATFGAAWGLGTNVRGRRSQSEALAAYAAELAATREELAQRRVGNERLRIAREMHDVVAHTLGVVAVQAGAAEHLLEKDPLQARQSLSAIGDVARSGLTDMRRVLGLLRTNDGATDRAVSPRLGDVPQLLAELQEVCQVGAQLEVSGSPPERVDPALELSVYRVIQEALTNARKHAPGSRVTVKVAYGADEVAVEIADDGNRSNALDLPGSGNGLLGMRERVGMFGGTFEASQGADGGFRVAARFPLAGGLT